MKIFALHNMRGLVIFAMLLSAAASTRVPSYAAQQDLLMRLREEINKDSDMSAITSTPETTGPAVTSSSSTSAPNEEASSVKPITQSSSNQPQEEVASELPVSLPPLSVSETEPDKRRYVTYDQRQEGQYNIRADLENFMIVLIPPNPVEGLNLLDLLTKSSYRRSHQSLNKNKRKHSSVLQLPTQNNGIRQALKGGSGQSFNVISRTSPSFLSSAKQVPIAIIDSSSGSSSSQRLPEFIEGRTPYHVDISASDNDQLRSHPDRQVDVLPPPYPLAYQHLIKPFHLEAEPTVIQALPPPEAHAATSNFLESYNQLLTSGLQTAAAAESNSRARHNNDGPELGYYRISRAIPSDNSIDTNNLNGSPSTPHRFSFIRQHLIDRYPPIDVPETFFALKAQRRSSEHQQDSIDQTLDDDVLLPRIIVPPLYNFPQDDIEQDLHNVRLLDSESKALLSDGMERCAPGHRRDSYGMCREIEGY